MSLVSLLAAACAGSWAPAFHETLAEAEKDSVWIAAPTDALTFARIATPRGPRVIAVTEWKDGRVSGVDLSALSGGERDDAIVVFHERGYDALRDDVLGAPERVRVSVAAEDLRIPVEFGDRHVAVGTNYPEHASDAGTVRPFLFPKIVQPGVSGDTVSAGKGLLDHEVEIAVMPLEPLAAGANPKFLGLLLANDFTDRETLMHEVDRHDIESGKGFTTGKSFPGYLPVGSLLVIPRDWRAFVKDLELRLFVNGALRQRSLASEMVWNVDEILAQTLARRGERWDFRGGDVPLFEGDTLPARTLVLTGTPHGTVFAGLPPLVMGAGLLRWLAGGWGAGIPGQVIATYVDVAREARAYLQPGDDVRIHVQGLGQIRSRVVP